jgi:HTH-type transcriptional regulator/antitoxin HipB
MPIQKDQTLNQEPARRLERRAGSFVGNSRHSASARFGLALRARRKVLGMTQTDLAQASGLNRSFISDVERGEESISLDRAEKLARSVDCKLVDLLAEVE